PRCFSHPCSGCSQTTSGNTLLMAARMQSTGPRDRGCQPSGIFSRSTGGTTPQSSTITSQLTMFTLASCYDQFADSADSGEFAAGRVEVEIPQVIRQILRRLTLGPIIGIVFQIPQPGVIFLPVDILDRLHWV